MSKSRRLIPLPESVGTGHNKDRVEQWLIVSDLTEFEEWLTEALQKLREEDHAGLPSESVR